MHPSVLEQSEVQRSGVPQAKVTVRREDVRAAGPRMPVAPQRASGSGLGGFLGRFRASLVILSEMGHGVELALDQTRTTFGRGPGVDFAFDDPLLSQVHAVLEFASGGFRIRGLDGAGDVRVNGNGATVRRLRHGDEIQFGAERLEFVLSSM